MNKIGKKTKEWSLVRDTELKKEFDKRGINYCEFKFRVCVGNLFGFTFAHVLRRRNLGKWESEERAFNLRNVALACPMCHDYLDVKLGPVVGGRLIQEQINRREHKEFFNDI